MSRHARARRFRRGWRAGMACAIAMVEADASKREAAFMRPGAVGCFIGDAAAESTIGAIKGLAEELRAVRYPRGQELRH